MNDCVSRVSESCGELVVIVVAMLMTSGVSGSTVKVETCGGVSGETIEADGSLVSRLGSSRRCRKPPRTSKAAESIQQIRASRTANNALRARNLWHKAGDELLVVVGGGGGAADRF